MTDHLETYRKHLRHVVRPDDSRERLDARHILINDYDGMLIRWCLEEYVAYGGATELHRGIAESYIEYIEMAVHEERKRTFRIYVHTKEAKQVLEEAILSAPISLPTEWVDNMVYEVDNMVGRPERLKYE